MPFYGLTNSNASNRPARRQPMPLGRSSGGMSGPRSIPERIDASDPAMGLVEAAETAPGYVYERPISLVRQVGQMGIPGLSAAARLLDGAGDLVEGAKGLPVVGGLVQGASDLLEADAKVGPAMMNSRTAASLRYARGLPDDAPMPFTDPMMMANPLTLGGTVLRQADQFVHGQQVTGPGFATVGEMRADAMARGFTRQDIADIESGKRGIYDWAEKKTHENVLYDMGGRLVIDPLNAAMILGPARIAGGLRALPGGEQVAAATDRLLRLTEAQSVVDAGMVRALAAPKGVRAGVAALRAGVTEGVTRQSLGLFLMGMGRGGSALLGSYRKAALLTTAGQIAVNTVDDVMADKTGVPGPLNSLFELGRAMRDDRPLSESMLFNLFAVTHFPIRSDVASIKGDLGRVIPQGAKDRIRIVGPNGADIKARVGERFGDGDWGRFVERFGGEESAADFIGYVTKKTREHRILSALSDMPTVRSFTEAMMHSRLMNKLVRDAVRLDPPKGSEVVEAALDFVTNARGSGEAYAGLRSTFDATLAGQQWQAFRTVAIKTSELSNGAVVPKLQNKLIRENVQVARERFRMAAVDGKVQAQEALRIIQDNPAMMLDNETGAFWGRLLVRGAEPVELSWVLQRLEKVEEKALRMREVLAPLEQWEARAGRERATRAGLIKPDGTLDVDNLQTSDVRIVVPSERDAVRRDLGIPDDSLEAAMARRQHPEVAATESAETLGVLDVAGYATNGAITRGVVARRGEYQTALEIGADARMGKQDAAQIAVHMMDRSGGRESRIIYTGRALDAHPELVPNSVHLRWTIGPHDLGLAEQASATLARIFPDAYIGDTKGVYEVYLRDGSRALSRLDDAAREMASLFPDRSVAGMYAPTPQRAFIETIRDTAEGNRRGRAARAAGAERSVADVRKRAAISRQWWMARNEFDNLDAARAADPGGMVGVAAQPGPDLGPMGAADDAGRGRVADPGDPGRVAEGLSKVGVDPEGVRWMLDRDAEVGRFMPNFHQSIADAYDDDTLRALAPLQEELTRFDPTYTMAKPPKRSTPFESGQGRIYEQYVLPRQMTADLWRYKVGSKAANMWNGLFGRVYTKRLKDDMKQALMAELVPAGASPRQVGQLLAALQKETETTLLSGKGQLWQRLDMLPPGQIDLIARGAKGDMGIKWQGLPEDVFKALGPDAVSKALNRSASRVFRTIEKGARAKSGEGSLGKLLDLFYGGSKGTMDTAGQGLHYVRAWYPLFRFKLDPRWHLMNMFEARTIGAVRFGISPDPSPRALAKWGPGRTANAQAMERAIRSPLNTSFRGLGDDMLAAGGLDKRHLEAFIGPAFREERLASTKDALTALAGGDPIIRLVKDEYGALMTPKDLQDYSDMVRGVLGRRIERRGAKVTPEEYVRELDDMMYHWDAKGALETLNDEAKRLLTTDGYAEMQPFLQHIGKVHEQVFDDVVHAFHGNTNRSNMERLANSYFLYWPISYQLKVGKVLFDVLTKRSFGRDTGFLGAWTVDRLMKEHVSRLGSDPEYVQMFEDHPELWRAAGMFLPITPMDIGISLSRPTRYVSSAIGAALGLWDRDEAYPDPTTLSGAIDFSARLMDMGPIYTKELIEQLAREYEE